MSTPTKKQKTFCNEYIIDLNGAQAAIRAGYSETNARRVATRLLSKAHIQDYIAVLLKKRSNRTEITQDRVLLEIARLAFNDPRKAFGEHNTLLPIQKWPDEVAAAISSIKVSQINAGNDSSYEVKEVKFWDKGRQLELLSKHLGLLNKAASDDDIPPSVEIVINRVDAS